MRCSLGHFPVHLLMNQTPSFHISSLKLETSRRDCPLFLTNCMRQNGYQITFVIYCEQATFFVSFIAQDL